MKKMQLLFLFFFLITGLLSEAQNQKIDSMVTLLEVDDHKNKLDILLELAHECIEYDNQRGLGYINLAIPLAYQSGDSGKIVLAKRYKTGLLFRLERNGEALIEGREALLIARRNNNKREMMILLNHLGIVSVRFAKYDQALLYYFETLKIREEFKDWHAVGITLNNIAVTYFKLNDGEKALEFFRKALVTKREIKDNWDLERLFINMGLAFRILEKYDSALKFINLGFSNCANNCPSHIKMEGQIALGETYFAMSRLDEAEKHFLISYELAQQVNNPRFVIDNLIGLSKVKVRNKDYQAAEIFLQKAEQLMSGTGYNEFILAVYRDLSKLYSERGLADKAAIYLKKYLDLKDGLFNEELIRNLSKMRADYEEQENTSKLESQARILELQQQSIRNQVILNLTIGALALLAIGMTIILFRLNRQKQKINEMLDQRVRERTWELEKNRDELKHSHDEQVMILKRVSSDLMSSWATLNGLSNLASKDLPEEQAIYFKEAEATAERIVNYVNMYSPKE